MEGQALVDALGSRLHAHLEVVSNHGVGPEVAQQLGADWCAAHTLRVTLTWATSPHGAGEGLAAEEEQEEAVGGGEGGWELYMHSIRRVLRCDSAEFEARAHTSPTPPHIHPQRRPS